MSCCVLLCRLLANQQERGAAERCLLHLGLGVDVPRCCMQGSGYDAPLCPGCAALYHAAHVLAFDVLYNQFACVNNCWAVPNGVGVHRSLSACLGGMPVV